STTSPTARRKHVFFFQLANIYAAHCFAEILACFKHSLRIIKMRRRLHHGLGPRFWIARLEDARANENRFRAETPNQRCIRWSGDASRGEIRHRKFASLCDLTD